MPEKMPAHRPISLRTPRCRARAFLVRVFAAVALLAGAARGFAASGDWAVEFYNHYRATPNLTYKVIGKNELKLDIYQRSDVTGPVPTLFFVHGGGWVHQSKSDVLGNILPWLEWGWTVVNVDYRLAGEASAPAAVDDCRCALRWVAANAEKYHFDLKRLVISGASAGGELALVTGMAPDNAGLDQDGPGGPRPDAAAFVNYSGILDVTDLVQGPHLTTWAVTWIPNGPGQLEMARKVSPLTYVRVGLPPILTIHGDADDAVPYQQAVRFHEALTRAGVSNQLVTIAGGKHGGYTIAENVQLYAAIRAFLTAHQLIPPEFSTK